MVGTISFCVASNGVVNTGNECLAERANIQRILFSFEPSVSFLPPDQ